MYFLTAFNEFVAKFVERGRNGYYYWERIWHHLFATLSYLWLSAAFLGLWRGGGVVRVVGGGGVVGRARGPCRVRVLIVLRPWATLAPPPPTPRAGAPTLLRRKNRKLQPFLVAVTTARLVTMGMTPAPTLPRAPPGTGENRLVKYGVGLTRRSNRYYGDMGLWARKVTRINKPGPFPPTATRPPQSSNSINYSEPVKQHLHSIPPPPPPSYQSRDWK